MHDRGLPLVLRSCFSWSAPLCYEYCGTLGNRNGLFSQVASVLAVSSQALLAYVVLGCTDGKHASQAYLLIGKTDTLMNNVKIEDGETSMGFADA